MAEAHDRYWKSIPRTRTEARSLDRAGIAVALLAGRGVRAGRLLDAGCGPGWALDAFARSGFDVLGIDASDLAVAEARGRGLDARSVDLGAASAGDLLSSLGGPFDVVTALEVLEHVPDPVETLRRLADLLRPGGHIVVSLPNEIHLPARLAVLLGRLPFGGHDDPHIRHFDVRRGRRLIEASGLPALAWRPASVVPPRMRLLRLASAPLATLFPGLFAIAVVTILGGPSRGAR